MRNPSDRFVLSGRNPFDRTLIGIAVRNGVVESIEAGRLAGETWISPGFVDLQVNGFGGDDINGHRLTPETVILLTRKMLAIGVTTFLPTIITASEEKIIAALHAIALARKNDQLTADCIPFAHLEGPHISPLDGFRGAHPVEHVRPPSLDEFARWQQACGGLVGMVTLSPHFGGAADYISHLTAQGVHVAIGHTHASREEIRAAVDAGAALSTHLGNGIAGMIPRHPNPIWTQLADDRLTATMIADGHHLPSDTLKAMVRAKGVSRSILVSDSVALAGMSPGIYDAPVGGRVELQPSGRLSLAGSEILAGAASPLKDGIARAMAMADISLGDAIRMATENPGRFAGGVGGLRVGMPANLVSFSFEPGANTLQIEKVFVKGKEIPSPSLCAG